MLHRWQYITFKKTDNKILSFTPLKKIKLNQKAAPPLSKELQYCTESQWQAEKSPEDFLMAGKFLLTVINVCDSYQSLETAEFTVGDLLQKKAHESFWLQDNSWEKTIRSSYLCYLNCPLQKGNGLREEICVCKPVTSPHFMSFQTKKDSAKEVSCILVASPTIFQPQSSPQGKGANTNIKSSPRM